MFLVNDMGVNTLCLACSSILVLSSVIIWGKNGKNSENPVGSNKSEKRKPKSAVYRRILASVVYFHLRIISAKNHKRKMTRNRLIGDEPVRGFESHPLRQKASNVNALLASFL